MPTDPVFAKVLANQFRAGRKQKIPNINPNTDLSDAKFKKFGKKTIQVSGVMSV